MLIEVSSHGTFIGKSGQSIKITCRGQKLQEVPVVKLTEIIVSASTSISSDAVKLLAENGVPVLFMGGGKPVALLHGFFMHGTVLTRREQITAYSDERGTHLAKTFVDAGMTNKHRLLSYFANSRKRTNPTLADHLETAIQEIKRVQEKLGGINGLIAENRFELMGLEAEATRIYYQALRLILPEEIRFQRREKRPPRDPFNSALSLGYTILNSRVLAAVTACGLEPFAGYLHADRSGKPSLVLDLSEEFRQPLVDRTAVSMFTQGTLTHKDFEHTEGRLLFSEEAKKKYIEAILARLESEAKPEESKTPLENRIFHQAREIARYLLGKAQSYTPYTFEWWGSGGDDQNE
ncbi:MAG: CRISPR-associated endonuclease Cas1 [Candidatus Jordarchaeum sp.]|uniref:CRISPR-associated endonuclease Cas1 n=1 Tax=Candidatus Jordarchaeum sp. TaxID=2823881 RepID=UPI00404AAD7F